MFLRSKHLLMEKSSSKTRSPRQGFVRYSHLKMTIFATHSRPENKLDVRCSSVRAQMAAGSHQHSLEGGPNWWGGNKQKTKINFYKWDHRCQVMGHSGQKFKRRFLLSWTTKSLERCLLEMIENKFFLRICFQVNYNAQITAGPSSPRQIIVFGSHIFEFYHLGAHSQQQ